jgi:hypothetical protein
VSPSGDRKRIQDLAKGNPASHLASGIYYSSGVCSSTPVTMSKKAAPWIVLTTEKPGMDAQNRNAINEWCGVVGKQSFRRQSKVNIQFPSRAVNWKNQQRSNSDLKVANLLADFEDQPPPSARPRPAQRTKSSDNIGSKEATVKSRTKPVTGSRARSKMKKGELVVKCRTRSTPSTYC